MTFICIQYLNLVSFIALHIKRCKRCMFTDCFVKTFQGEGETQSHDKVLSTMPGMNQNTNKTKNGNKCSSILWEIHKGNYAVSKKTNVTIQSLKYILNRKAKYTTNYLVLKTPDIVQSSVTMQCATSFVFHITQDISIMQMQKFLAAYPNQEHHLLLLGIIVMLEGKLYLVCKVCSI